MDHRYGVRLLTSGTLATLLILMLGIPELAAQVAIDVKSSWGVKQKVRFAKQGVTVAIDAVDWARATEFGEDYSLWLRSLERRKEASGVVRVRLSLEIRTPTFLGRGELLSAERVEIRYDAAALDSLIAHPASGIDPDEWLASSTMIDQVITIAGEVLPLPNALLRTALLSVARSLNRAPTDGEILEGTLLGLKAVSLLEHRLIELGENH